MNLPLNINKTPQYYKKPSYSLKPFFFGGDKDVLDSIKFEHAAQDSKIIKKIKLDNINKDFVQLKDTNQKILISHQQFLTFMKREKVQNSAPRKKSQSEHLQQSQGQGQDGQLAGLGTQERMLQLEKKFQELSKISEASEKYMKKIQNKFDKQPIDQNFFLKKSTSKNKDIDTQQYWQNALSKNSYHKIIGQIINCQKNKETSFTILNQNNQSQFQDSSQNHDQYDSYLKKMRQIKELSQELQITEIQALKLTFKEVFDYINEYHLYDQDAIQIKLNQYQTNISNETEDLKKNIQLFSAIKFVIFLSQLEPDEKQQNHNSKNQSNIQKNILNRKRNISSPQLSQRFRGISIIQTPTNNVQSPSSNNLNNDQYKPKQPHLSAYSKCKDSNSLKISTTVQLEEQNSNSQITISQSEHLNKTQIKKNKYNDALSQIIDQKSETQPIFQNFHYSSAQPSPHNLKYHVISNFIIKGKDLTQLNSPHRQQQSSHGYSKSIHNSYKPSHYQQSKNILSQKSLSNIFKQNESNENLEENFTGYYESFEMKVKEAMNNDKINLSNSQITNDKSKYDISQNDVQGQKDFVDIDEQALKCIEQAWNNKFGTPSSRKEVLNLAFNTASSKNIKNKLTSLYNQTHFKKCQTPRRNGSFESMISNKNQQSQDQLK